MSVLIIDGSNLRSGGGVTHLVEILNNMNIERFPFEKVIVFSGKKTLQKIKNNSIIEKRSHILLNMSLPFILLWKFLYLERFLKKLKEKAVLLDPAGTYNGTFRPYISMSRNMLIFEEQESNRFQEWKMRERFRILRKQQVKTFNKAQGIIFISNYAKETILPFLKPREFDYKLIHHGVSKRFRSLPKVQYPISSYTVEKPFKFLYVSPITVYKHQKNVLRAFHELFHVDKLPVKITFVGDYYEPEYKEFLEVKSRLDPKNDFSEYVGKIDYQMLDVYYKEADGIIFASTCENMPNVLIESMTSGSPLLCSNKKPMSEFLGPNFPFSIDPTRVSSIVETTRYFLNNPKTRMQSIMDNLENSESYDWAICSKETFSYLSRFIN
ncbi:glycosyltransferase involved in cell wall biosynthesis [Sphingobacterium allocomposti]|uniref:Glycosyltransferase involved in cell wall biosynthesis n=1 Tax=Sphingobacterium allocomposti TaxID=415956 RepID=A0A5S5DF54_9SPHI|nr:glycosyltransferase [Sphingobacterium composti Yoo et al. 2007 non Ten et al. 2007]TYP94607.1 glycosyltransferase involved in cell wall biosynthesis [Sphingobacterium composti Yoo et al. 2007 non Ten et al. 2007]